MTGAKKSEKMLTVFPVQIMDDFRTMSLVRDVSQPCIGELRNERTRIGAESVEVYEVGD